MVAAVRDKESIRSVARRFHVSLSVVQRWVRWAGDQRLDAVGWSGRQRGCRRSANRTDTSLEEMILEIRKRLREESALGEYGAAAIYREMTARGLKDIPSLRTIGRILERRGTLDGRRFVATPHFSGHGSPRPPSR